MKNLRYFLSLAIAIAAVAAARADAVSAAAAQRAAQRWIDRGESMARLDGRKVESVETLAAGDAKIHLAHLASGGFIVMSADDLIEPVIAFAADGAALDCDDRNPLWALIKADIASRTAAAAATAENSSAFSVSSASSSAGDRTAAQRRWDALLADAASTASVTAVDESGIITPIAYASAATISDVRVDSFVDSRWSQSTVGGINVYNYYTPNNYVCGCVATATAQIMRYFRWPTTSVTAKTFSCKVDGVAADYTMKGGVYDFDSMPLVPTGSITATEAQAIGRLTYDIGCSVGMSWKSGGSGSSEFSAMLRLKDLFGYASAEAVAFCANYEYSLDHCKQVVIPSLDYGSPLIMGVSGDQGGHAVVVDGYGYSGDDFYLHVNCGWGGSSDAWYCPPDMSMGSYDFDAIEGFVFQILPDESGVILSGRVLDAAGAPIAGATVTLSRGTTVKATATSNASGIYALVAPAAGSYTLKATYGGDSVALGKTVVANDSKQIAPGGGYYYSAAYAPTVGCSCDNDLQITGVAGVEPPAFSPADCTFYPSTNVVITCATAGAVIHYTLDGSDPTESSAVYSAPITVTDDTVIRARAYKSGLNASVIISAIYTYDRVLGGAKGDYYAKPIAIAGASGSYVIDDNTDYTVEDDEASHTLQDGYLNYEYRTSWYKWTAPGSGEMTFTVKFIGRDETYSYLLPAAVAIYSDAESIPTSTATRLAMSKDYESSGDYTTSVTLTVTQGTTYRIVGVPIYDMGGSFTLTWSGDLTITPTATAETEVPVPYTWLKEYYPDRGTSAADYESLGNSLGANGYPVWSSYVAGLIPTDADSLLVSTIRLENGAPIVEWNVTNANAAALGYEYRVKGKAELSDASWAATNATTRFFKVFLEKRAP